MHTFLGAQPGGDRGEAVILGIAFDGKYANRPGARLAPDAIREASQNLETFSPFLDSDLRVRDYLDWGDLEFDPNSVDSMVEKTEKTISEILTKDFKPIVFGGEHTITLGIIQALAIKYPDLMVLQIGARADFKDEFNGEKVCHATTMRRISEIVSKDRIYRIGIRRGTRDELIEAGVSLPLPIDNTAIEMHVDEYMRSIPKDAPLFVTFDMSVFDPSLVPGVVLPEPNGFSWREFVKVVRAITFNNLIGFDIVELAPKYDQTGVSAVVAASVAREFMLALMK